MHKINKAHQVRLMTLGSSWRIVGLISCGGLTLLILCMVIPIVTSSTNAVESRISTTDSIALAISPNVDIDLTPTTEGSFGATTVAMRVASSSNAGYSLYVNTADGTTSMVNTDANQTASIAPVAKDSKATEFTNNTWGFSIDQATADTNTTYQAVPAVSTEVLSSNQANANDQLYLHVGAKIDTALPAGQYSNNLVVSAVAHPSYVTGLMSLTYMQDMTSNICQDTKAANGANTVTPGNEVEKRLIDVRDGKEYWVAKLADGNCWMTQNLALDLNEKTLPLKPETSDVSEEWRPTALTETTIPVALSPSEYGSIYNYNHTRSWNLGNYVLTTPERSRMCQLPGQTDWNSLPTGVSLSACENLQNVDNWSPSFVAQNGKWGDYNGYVAVTDGAYDAHYTIGNYYMWSAATVNTNSLTSPGGDHSNYNPNDATSSICPKGWRLPKGGMNVINAEKQFADYTKLFLSYNWILQDLVANQRVVITGGNSARKPFYITQAGTISLAMGTLRYVGNSDFYALSTAVGHPDAEFMYVTWAQSIDTVVPSLKFNRFHAVSVRCLAR